MLSKKTSLFQALGILTRDELCNHSLFFGTEKHQYLTDILCQELDLRESKPSQTKTFTEKKENLELLELRVGDKAQECLDNFYREYLRLKEGTFFHRIRPEKSKIIDKIIEMPNFILKEKKKFKKIYKEIKKKEVLSTYISNAKKIISLKKPKAKEKKESN